MVNSNSMALLKKILIIIKKLFKLIILCSKLWYSIASPVVSLTCTSCFMATMGSVINILQVTETTSNTKYFFQDNVIISSFLIHLFNFLAVCQVSR